MNKGNNLSAAVIVLISAVALVALGFYFQNLVGEVHLVSAKLVVIIINIFTAIIVLGSLILVRKLFLLERQDKLIEVQEFYFERLQELVTVTRAQRHDFINHLQAVYALLKTDQNDEAQSYIENLYHDIRISGEIMHLSIPEVAALLLVKMGNASLKNISFAVEVESNLKGLRVKAIELNSIIGNLVVVFCVSGIFLCPYHWPIFLVGLLLSSMGLFFLLDGMHKILPICARTATTFL